MRRHLGIPGRGARLDRRRAAGRRGRVALGWTFRRVRVAPGGERGLRHGRRGRYRVPARLHRRTPSWLERPLRAQRGRGRSAGALLGQRVPRRRLRRSRLAHRPCRIVRMHVRRRYGQPMQAADNHAVPRRNVQPRFAMCDRRDAAGSVRRLRARVRRDPHAGDRPGAPPRHVCGVGCDAHSRRGLGRERPALRGPRALVTSMCRRRGVRPSGLVAVRVLHREGRDCALPVGSIHEQTRLLRHGPRHARMLGVLLRRAEHGLHGRHRGDVRRHGLSDAPARHLERAPVVRGAPRRPVRRVRGRCRPERRPLQAGRRCAERAAHAGEPDHDLLHPVEAR